MESNFPRTSAIPVTIHAEFGLFSIPRIMPVI